MILSSNGISLEELGVDSIMQNFQSSMSIMLLGFLIWDYIAYFYFLKYRNWARRYILSIAFFYIITCIFDFSISQLIYGLFTAYYLMGAREAFLPKTGKSL